jgi:hypothetical protein
VVFLNKLGLFRKSDFKTVAICMTYPVNYPQNHILVEIKSKNLSRKLLDGLERVSEAEAKKVNDKPHVLLILKFINQFFDDNPLACCSEEIANVKKLLGDEGTIKLSQKNSSLTLHVVQKKYYLKTRVVIPNNYPSERIVLEDVESNFPRVFKVWFFEQAKEIARRCVDPPMKPKPNLPPFQPKPSLEPAVGFLVTNVKRYPNEPCQKCKVKAFPDDPANAIHKEHAAAHVERVYCSHIYHHDCLILYMKTPPFQGTSCIALHFKNFKSCLIQIFVSGGKKCLGCDNRIYHEKWKVTPELAEARWAHEQARIRELGEVVEFFGDLATGS